MRKENFWHCGHAKEAACACKKFAFEHLNRDKVLSIIKAAHLAFMQVAQSIDMPKEDEWITQYDHGDMLHRLRSVQREIPAFQTERREYPVKRRSAASGGGEAIPKRRCAQNALPCGARLW